MTAIAEKPARRGRGTRTALRAVRDVKMLPSLKRGLPLTEPMSAEEIERIDAASMDILENVGVVFRDEIAIADWKRAGAEVRDGDRVHLDRGLVRELIRSIPESFTYHARNPAHNLPFGREHAIFVPMTGAPFLRDLDDVRRNPTLEDLANFHKLAQMSPALHSSAHHIVEPYDHPISQRHLRITYSSMKHSDKTFMGMTTSPKNAEDVMEMCAILFGEAFMETHPVVTGNCNGNSPLVWDETMLGAMRAFCRRNQPVLCSPFVLGGANTPASVAPTVAQLNAEALSALAYTQVVRKGCPAIYGHYLSTVSMKSGAPMAGTPEISLMNLMIGQMARFYGVPWRSSTNLGGAKTLDAQAGYESATTLMALQMAGTNYMWHAAGWNEAGMHCSMAKFVIDAEQCAMAYRMAEGIRWDDFDEAVAAVGDIGPGGHYLGHPHTLANFQRAFFMPDLFDNNSIEQWQAEGAVEANARAQAYARKMLNEYEEPKLDEAVNEALLAYIAKRESEIPAADALNQEY
ncbi:trimethylamine methyltransferase family protein [Roseovarius atlanticus]|uniref:trimethylamine methyltransferase family protein n=1 Tax=Roseovarius atlanticus TaxID=1641875 RepID=UPI001C9896D6|nr:trimethylamine methyltransferase family protein [Roseovarius atlanticus]MBY5989818.1 trimethylamine methyltransferase family protein [Roseovarius atlanticus]MBY6126363.1 trimethylamine methyltransferase family protein [Roseovarius atlanticus]MBY6150857.1 trimethylamine methyltransferase family protein [Roseovarius atlanticus]